MTDLCYKAANSLCATNRMKRIATWALYAVGAVSVAYIALSIYAMLTAPRLEPGDPVRIFRKPDAPSYSALTRPV